MITKIRITIIVTAITRTTTVVATTQPIKCYQDINKEIGNTNLKMEVVFSIRWTEILKYTFHIIPYIHSPIIGLFLHISTAIMTTFSGTSLIKK